MKNCPDCNSQKIIKSAKALDRGDANGNHIMQIAVDEKPDALIFKQRNYSTIKAEVCGDCGFIQFYAENPNLLWMAYQNQQNEI